MVASLPQMAVACLAIGVAAGVVMHRSDYCLTMGYRVTVEKEENHYRVIVGAGD